MDLRPIGTIKTFDHKRHSGNITFVCVTASSTLIPDQVDGLVPRDDDLLRLPVHDRAPESHTNLTHNRGVPPLPFPNALEWNLRFVVMMER